MKISRRTFVKTVSAGAALAAMEGQLSLLSPGADKAFGATTYANYVCKMCSGGCKGKVKIVDGVPVELVGDNGSQTSRGRLCVKGLSALRLYKSSSRVSKPLIRTNPEKGPGVDPMFREASWNEAMDLILEKMKAAIETPGHGGRSIVFAYRPSPGDITNRLAQSVGSPNDMCHHDTCYTSHDVAWAVHAHAQDIQENWAPFVEGTDYTLDDSAGTITRVGTAIKDHEPIYVLYTGTDGKQHRDFVEFEPGHDTASLSGPLDRGAMVPKVLIKPTKKSGRNWTHDIARSTYIVSFGWDMPGKAKNMMAQDYVWAITHGAKAVVFEPRLSTTAALAKQNGGEWVPVKPGSDLAVMFAMMKVIVGDGVHKSDGGTGIWNKDYCGTYAVPAAGVSGFPQFIDHIKGNAFAGEDTIPGGTGDGSAADVAAVLVWAEAKSGVSAATIERIAREFANEGDYTNWRPYIASHKRDAGGPNYRNSFEVAESIVLLNALVGAIDRVGGSIKQRQHSLKDLSWVCPMPSDFHIATHERVDHLQNFPTQYKMNKGSYQYIADSILSGEPYPIDVVLFRKYNVLGLPDPQKWYEALKRVFVVCVEIQMSETTQMADVVLPELFWLEGRGFDRAEYFSLWPQIMVTEGAVPKRFVHTNDSTVAGSGPKGWRDILLTTFPKRWLDTYPSWVHPETGYHPAELFRYNPGGSYDNTKNYIWAEKLGGSSAYGASKCYDHAVLKQLGVALSDSTLAPDSNYFTKTGGWEAIASKANFPDGLYPAANGANYNMVGGTFPVPLSNPSGGNTFAPKYGTASAPVQFYSQVLAAYGYDPLPKWRNRRQEKSGSYDLYMVTDHPVPHIHSTTQSLDYNSELYGEAVLWIHPQTAAAKGIQTGDWVMVNAAPVASKGSGRTVRIRALVTERVKPDVVCFPHGWGHWSKEYPAYAKTGACDGEMIPIPPIAEILSENTPQPGVRMTDVVVNVSKVS